MDGSTDGLMRLFWTSEHDRDTIWCILSGALRTDGPTDELMHGRTDQRMDMPSQSVASRRHLSRTFDEKFSQSQRVPFNSTVFMLEAKIHILPSQIMIMPATATAGVNNPKSFSRFKIFGKQIFHESLTAPTEA